MFIASLRPSHVALAGGLALAAGAAGAAEFASVVSATPVVGAVAVPRTECADVQRTVQPQPSGAGALVGAVVGGVLGNTIGHGGGRVLATGLGAVGGAVVGNNVEANGASSQVYSTRDCRTVSVAENRVVGYDVVYEYNGQRYTTRTARDPGPRIAVDVRPAQAPLDRLAAAPVPPAGVDVPSQAVDPASTYAPQPAYAPAPAAQPVPAYTYGSAPPVAYYPQPAYVVERPYYYGAPYYPYYWGPSISLGFGYWGGHGWRGGGGGWHGGRGGWHR